MSPGAVRTELVVDSVRFHALREDWNALLEASPSNSVTLTWEWLTTWWRVYGEERDLRVVLVWEGSKLIGAAPLLVRKHPYRHYGILPYKRLELLASGEPAGEEICSDYLDWIARRGREAEITETILEFLASELRAQWQELVLPDVAESSPMLAELRRLSLGRGLVFEVLSRESSPYIQLPSSWEEYLASLSSNFRYKMRRGRREFEKAGGTYRIAQVGGDLEELLPILVALHQARWAARGLPGAFASARRLRFHQLLTPLMLERGWLRLGVLSLPTGPIGAIYNFRYAGRICFYQSGILPQESANLRPGMVLHSYEIEAAIAAGCTEYDFLKQGAPDYKDEWANAAHDLVCTRIARTGARHAALHLSRRAYRGLRAVKRLIAR